MLQIVKSDPIDINAYWRDHWLASHRDAEDVKVSAIGAEELPSRIIHLPDRKVAPRSEWIERVLPGHAQLCYEQQYLSNQLAGGEDFDLFVVHGDDPVRMAHILRDVAPLVNGRIKIALMSSSLPRDRARLLNAGFDDVFDTRMAPTEGIVRIRAINRRLNHSLKQALNAAHAQHSENCASLFVQPPSKRETYIASLLLDNCGTPVSHYRLSRSLAGSVIKRSSLKVLMSQMRRKLADHVSVVGSNFGYQLTIAPLGKAA